MGRAVPELSPCRPAGGRWRRRRSAPAWRGSSRRNRPRRSWPRTCRRSGVSSSSTCARWGLRRGARGPSGSGGRRGPLWPELCRVLGPRPHHQSSPGGCSAGHSSVPVPVCPRGVLARGTSRPPPVGPCLLPAGCGCRWDTPQGAPGRCTHILRVLILHLLCQTRGWHLGQKAILWDETPERRSLALQFCPAGKNREALQVPKHTGGRKQRTQTWCQPPPQPPVLPGSPQSPPVSPGSWGSKGQGVRGGGSAAAGSGLLAGAGPDESVL